MKNIKICYVPFASHNRNGIEKYLEEKAREGWMLEKLTDFLWKFRRIEPKKMRFSVTYFPKASDFDTKPSDEQESFYDLCEHSGWKLVTSDAQIQIFCSEEENPTPIETDAVLEVATIHSAKKKYLITNYIITVLGLIHFITYLMLFFQNPIAFLSKGEMFISTFCSLMIPTLYAVEIGKYYAWYKKAKRTAELNGEFIETKGRENFQHITPCLLILDVIFYIFSTIDSKKTIIALIFASIAFGAVILAVLIHIMMKKLKASTKLNRTLIIVLVSLIVSCGMGTLIYSINDSKSVLYAKRDTAEIYEYNGLTHKTYHDDIPLKIEDLTETDYEGYSYQIVSYDKSVLVEQIVVKQRPRADALKNPSLDYSVVTPKAPFLYNFCKNEMFDIWKRNYGEDVEKCKIDASPWKAKEAYQVKYCDEMTNTFLICYENNIVQISFEYDWQVTAEQMEIVAQKLGK